LQRVLAEEGIALTEAIYYRDYLASMIATPLPKPSAIMLIHFPAINCVN